MIKISIEATGQNNYLEKTYEIEIFNNLTNQQRPEYGNYDVNITYYNKELILKKEHDINNIHGVIIPTFETVKKEKVIKINHHKRDEGMIKLIGRIFKILEVEQC